MRRHANRLLWAGLAFIVLGIGGCFIGFTEAMTGTEDGSILTVGVLSFVGGILLVAIGALIKAFTSSD